MIFFTTRDFPRIMLVFPRCADCLFIRTALTQQFCPVGGGVCPQRLTPSRGTYAWPQMTATFVTEIITGLNAPFFYCTKSSKSKLLGCFRTILEISSTRTDFRSTLYRKHCSPDQHGLSFSWTAKLLESCPKTKTFVIIVSEFPRNYEKARESSLYGLFQDSPETLQSIYCLNTFKQSRLLDD